MVTKFKKSLEGGLLFIDYLETTGRKWENDKKQLKEIYNKEFRYRNEVSYPNFSSVLYALVRSRKATVHGDWVQLVLQNQRRPYRQNQPRNVPGGHEVSRAASTGDVAPVLLDQDQRSRLYFSDDKSIKITSDHEIVDGKIQLTFTAVEQVYTVKLFIENTGTSLVHLTSSSISQSCYKLTGGSKVTPAHPLHPEDTHEVQVEFQSDHYGVVQAKLLFEFLSSSLGTGQPFQIICLFEAEYKGPLAAELAPIAPYRPLRLPKQSNVKTWEEEGVKPNSSSVGNDLKTVAELRAYLCPEDLPQLIKFLNERSFSSRGSSKFQTRKSVLQSPLNFQNYSQRFMLLLHLEEHQMKNDIRKYSMENVTMTQDRNRKDLLVLDVPGLAENRPSLLRGDCILASKAENKEPLIKYKGYVHVVELNKVLLGFSDKLLQSFISNMKFNVEFKFSRLLLRLQHRAVDLAVRLNLEKVLFPTGPAPEIGPLHSPSLYDKKLERNEEQCSAIRHIVSGSSRPAPYLVFGPPGTGKTVTLVEAIKQVGKNKSAHILACTPCNSAADLLCERLLDHMERRNVYRLYAKTVDPKSIPNKLLDCCNFEDGEFVIPSKKTLMSYNVLVTTLYTAGRFVTGGFPMNHFAYIFVDEAGQATEPETMISIAGLLQAETGQVILAGDPKQLGPIIRSSLAKNYGLELSLLERLMSSNELYMKNPEGGFDERYITKLVKNYRSHPAILKIPNELFYDGELQYHADQIIRNSYCNWEPLPTKGFPIIFFGVTGKEQREQNSPSFFNVTEVEIIVRYLKKLFETQAKKGLQTLSPKDIGIIAPYRKQVQKIKTAITVADRELSRLRDIKDLKVGSVEEFQGQERKVIMISTVRSDTNHIKMDHELQMGFLINEKRFNVAVTRAKALLIVVGNPIILNTGRHWKRFIQYCTDEKGYLGVNYKESEDEALFIGADLRDETEESAIQRYVDPPFRREE